MLKRWLSVSLRGAHASLTPCSIACSSGALHTRFARQSTRSLPAVGLSQVAHACT